METINVTNEIEKYVEELNNTRDTNLRAKLSELEKQRDEYDKAIKYLKTILGEEPEIPIEKPLEQIKVPTSLEEEFDLSFLDEIKEVDEMIKQMYIKGWKSNIIYEALKIKGIVVTNKSFIYNRVYQFKQQELLARKYGTTLDTILILKNIFYKKQLDNLRSHVRLFDIAVKETNLEVNTIEKILVELRERDL